MNQLQDRAVTRVQTASAYFTNVPVCADRRHDHRFYLGMENRDAASLFIIFLHSVNHLGGDVRGALWETGGCVGRNKQEEEEEEEEEIPLKKTQIKDGPKHTACCIVIKTVTRGYGVIVRQ